MAHDKSYIATQSPLPWRLRVIATQSPLPWRLRVIATQSPLPWRERVRVRGNKGIQQAQ